MNEYSETHGYVLDGRGPAVVKLTGEKEEIDLLLQKLGNLDGFSYPDEEVKEDYGFLSHLLLDTVESKYVIDASFSQDSEGEDVYTVENSNFEGFDATEWERIVMRISEIAPNLVVTSKAPAWHPASGQMATISVNRVDEDEHIPEHMEDWYTDGWITEVDYEFDEDELEDEFEDEDSDDDKANKDSELYAELKNNPEYIDFEFEVEDGFIALKKYTGGSSRIHIPKDVGFIYNEVFHNPNVEHIDVSDQNEEYASVDGVLFDKEKKTIKGYPAGRKGSYTVPGGVDIYDQFTFKSQNGPSELHLPDSFTTIEYNYFSGCKKLEAIHVSENHEHLSSVDGVLYNKDKTSLLIYPAGKLGKITDIPNGVKEIGVKAFMGASLVIAKLSDGVKKICADAFRHCAELKEVVLPQGLNCIGDGGFDGCINLANISIPKSVTEIEHRAFSFCRSLTSITIPEGITKIEHATFLGCKSLTAITIPDSVTKIIKDAFDGCPNLTIIASKGSYAKGFAKRRGIPFRSLE